MENKGKNVFLGGFVTALVIFGGWCAFLFNAQKERDKYADSLHSSVSVTDTVNVLKKDLVQIISHGGLYERFHTDKGVFINANDPLIDKFNQEAIRRDVEIGQKYIFVSKGMHAKIATNVVGHHESVGPNILSVQKNN